MMSYRHHLRVCLLESRQSSKLYSAMKLVLVSAVFAIALLCPLAEASCEYEDIRLYDNGKSSNVKGMLQICDGERWTAVCDYGWRQEFSIAICSEYFNYSNPTPLSSPNNGSWSTIGYVAKYYSTYRAPSCSYNSSILDCLTNSSYYLTSYYARYYYCRNTRDTLYIQCNFDMGTCTRGSIRLYNNGTSTPARNGSNGLLQMCDSKGRWTAVCDYSWGCSESQVACRQLGFSGSRVRYGYNAGPWPIFGFGPYSYCSRYSSSLSSCYSYSSYYRNNVRYCNPLSDTVFLQCGTSTQTAERCTDNYKIRLLNGTETEESIEGRVDICYQNVWTPVCRYVYSYYYYYSSRQIGATLCNSMEDTRIASDFSVLYTDDRFGVSTTVDSITRISCGGSTQDIKYCSISQGDNGCNSNCPGSLGLKCYYRTGCNEGQIRLINGTIEREGRLEICINGVWGGFCPYNFRKSAAHVACKQAGYGDVMGAIIYTNGEFGHGDGPIIYGNVECFGHENYIADCSKSVAPNFTCYSYYGSSVGLLCRDNCSEGSVRLSGGSHSYEGFVEVCVDGVWTLVADNGWDNTDARVVCRQLKAYGTSAGEAMKSPIYTRPNRATRYSNVYCRGNEEMLEDCRHHTIELNEGKKYDEPVAAVDCKVVIPITNTPTPTTQTQSLAREDTILGTGVGLLVLAITILVVGITIMTCIIMRMRKLSIAKGGRNTEREETATMQHSRLKDEDYYDTAGVPNPLSDTKPHYEDVEILK